MSRKILKPGTFLFPCPVGLITTQSRDGKPNIITLAWLGMISSEPPMVSISVRPSRFSHQLLEENNEFVINIPSATDLEKVDFCGTVSGRNVDKFKEADYTWEMGSKVKAPIILECPMNIECRVKQMVRLGTHDVYMSEIVAAQVRDDILDENNSWSIKKINPLVYTSPSNDYWTLGENVGHYGFTKGKINRKDEE